MLFGKRQGPKYHALRVPQDLPSEFIELTTNLGSSDLPSPAFDNEVDLSHGLVSLIPTPAHETVWSYQAPAEFSFSRGLVSIVDQRQAQLRSERVLASIKRWLASVNEAHEPSEFETQDLEFGLAPDEGCDRKADHYLSKYMKSPTTTESHTNVESKRTNTNGSDRQTPKCNNTHTHKADDSTPVASENSYGVGGNSGSDVNHLIQQEHLRSRQFGEVYGILEQASLTLCLENTEKRDDPQL
ncbi:hypothetical protein KEM56_005011 [Ascosphaera pollenicola]|nr:hypothetical protein KEM56_005011 [Ascosphaera pollenicola]